MEELREYIFKKFNGKINNEEATMFLIDLLFDVNRKVLPNLSKEETYMLRKCYGIFDNGNIQSTLVIAEDLNCSEKNILFLLSIARKKLIIAINDAKDDLQSFMNKLSKPIIEDLELSQKAYNALKRANISTVDELCNFTISDLQKVNYLGVGLVEEVKQKLHDNNYHLKDEELTESKICNSLEELSLSKTVITVLKKNNIITIDELLATKKITLLSLPKMTKAMYAEVISKVHYSNLSFAEELVEFNLDSCNNEELLYIYKALLLEQDRLKESLEINSKAINELALKIATNSFKKRIK